ncbi:MAG: CvpA family protein [Stenotrophobium sp.]
MDWCIVAVFVISILVGVLRGFAHEILNLLTWVLAFVLAAVFGHMLADVFAAHINEPAVRVGCAYAILFIGGLLFGAILTHLLTDWISNSMFSNVNRTLGAGFGFLRGVFVITVFVLCASTMGSKQDRWWHQSIFVPQFEVLANLLKPVVPASWLDMLRPGAVPVAPSTLQKQRAS